MEHSTILFTGFPGFIGGRLIPRLLADAPGATVVALVEPRMVERARTAAAAIDPVRVVVEPGDITDPRLGLSPARYAELAASTTQVHHLAAVYDLAVPLAIAERVNVLGTQHVIAFCRAAPRLERHHYVSTCYVAGKRSGRVMEGDLAAGQAFKNHYESTKFGAEVLVRASMAEVPTTIYRPAIVVGDSRTGVTAKFDGPYYLLRSMQSLGPRAPIPQTGRGDATFNVVPVDFVIDAIAAGAASPEAVGETLHLCDPAPVTSAELNKTFARLYAGREPSYRVPAGVVDRALKLAPVRKLFGGTPRESVAYLNHPVSFDTTRADAILGAAGLRCPRFADYAPALVSFFREHQDDPAFGATP
ncbi:MAG: family oxidoreductase [Solirubrobacterales bacterium]|jgi:thioester reductase-like protein|nr:family oxidoreductase [Solirubrobacterales bacterium]